MFTKKKLSIFLLTAGVTMFLCGAYFCYQKVGFKKSGQQAGASLPSPTLKAGASFTGVEALTCTALFASGALMIGAGSYLLGSMKARNARSFTLDFSGRTGNQERAKV